MTTLRLQRFNAQCQALGWGREGSTYTTAYAVHELDATYYLTGDARKRWQETRKRLRRWPRLCRRCGCEFRTVGFATNVRECQACRHGGAS